jgi:FMN-dependent NADH-azoreductase
MQKMFDSYKRLISWKNLWNFKATSKYKNYFDASLKANLFQKNSSNSYEQGFLKVEL